MLDEFCILVYSVKRDFTCEKKDTDDKRKMTSTQVPPKTFESVGPTTKEGIPVSMRSVSSQPTLKTSPIVMLLNFYRKSMK